MKSLYSLPKSDRPREKLLEKGPLHLTDDELLAILIGSGVKGTNVLQLASKVRMLVDRRNGSLTVKDLKEVHGIGGAKACQIAAAIEFTRRRIRPEGIKISGPQDVMPLLQNYVDRKQEHFLCISLNGGHEVIAIRVVTIGLLNSSQVHPREVFAEPLTDRACAIVVAHNHPSGDIQPSREDREVTKRLSKAGEMLGIKLLDHVIFGRRGYFSFSEEGAITVE